VCVDVQIIANVSMTLVHWRHGIRANFLPLLGWMKFFNPDSEKFQANEK